MNLLWATLFQQTASPDTWVRGVYDPPVANPDLAAVFHDHDPNIRGWLVETVVQAVIRTSEGRDLVRRLDPANSYSHPLTGPRASFASPGYGVYPARVDHSLNRFRQVMRLLVDVGSLSAEIVFPDQTTASLTLEREGNILRNVPFTPAGGSVDVVLTPDASGELEIVVVGEVLPEGSGLEMFRSRSVDRNPSLGENNLSSLDIALLTARRALGDE